MNVARYDSRSVKMHPIACGICAGVGGAQVDSAVDGFQVTLQVPTRAAEHFSRVVDHVETMAVGAASESPVLQSSNSTTRENQEVVR